MADLSRAVDDLVKAAATEPDPRKLRPIVEKVLDAFDKAPKDARDNALKAIGKALSKAEGHGAQILCLALGALVEAGASPELAWPAVGRDLPALFESATVFATAVLREAKSNDIEEALDSHGAVVAKKKPREAAAWRALPARCLAGVACLTRSSALRAKIGSDESFLGAAWPLSDVISEVGDLLQAARIVDGEKLLVLAPSLGRGWRGVMNAIPSNLELYVLLADALAGDPKKGRISFGAKDARPNAKVVSIVRDGVTPKKPPVFVPPFVMVAGTAVDGDGTLPDIDPLESEDVIPIEGVPGDIPQLGDERIVLLQEATEAFASPVHVVPTFETLRPTLTIEGELTPVDVTRMMVKLASAAAATKASSEEEAPKAKAKAKPKAKAKAKAKPKTKTKRSTR